MSNLKRRVLYFGTMIGILTLTFVLAKAFIPTPRPTVPEMELYIPANNQWQIVHCTPIGEGTAGGSYQCGNYIVGYDTGLK